LKKILNWGNNVWFTGYGTFDHTYALEEVRPYGAPNIYPGTDLALTFYNGSKFKSIDMSNWVVDSSITSTNSMFSGCQKLKDVKLFNTQYITSMKGMFTHTSLDCDLSDINIASIGNGGKNDAMKDFYTSQPPWIPQSMSVANYDKLLYALANQPHNPNIELTVDALYSDDASHDALTSVSNWTINDGGHV
jgi:hypothetical protein